MLFKKAKSNLEKSQKKYSKTYVVNIINNANGINIIEVYLKEIENNLKLNKEE